LIAIKDQSTNVKYGVDEDEEDEIVDDTDLV
jgi:hypothetical protein